MPNGTYVGLVGSPSEFSLVGAVAADDLGSIYLVDTDFGVP